MTISEKLAFVASQKGENQENLLAQAFSEGVDALYREALIASYLAGRCSREEALRELGPELLAAVEQRRTAFEKDVEWGLGD